ncbi:protein-disulfide isomerase [Altererythrobacter atlanticus]|uniref:Thioredoxin-like fold domain-containing protein n=1 Tax=Croceibacterium atlanticum TaxID=1267766 RepID=A0A0F7KSY7_9SPHN|nr:thioredoxin domain-containing protein [Croceibacterium atlanticum]AKH42286.1 hypothetical protein WYH_01241 [Croceibacterium atlanticum]MBB5731063.1 protein-disulfide isomerase [Croceibacterium atlanticum]
MIFRRMAMAAMLVAGALFAGGATGSNWVNTVTVTDGGHLIGNPDAKVKLTEYISYTCHVCADFAREGEDPLKLAYVEPGKASLEIRHLIRDPVDLTAAMLANCGAPGKFPLNHSAFMRAQPEFMAVAQEANDAQMARWRNTDRPAARRAIASDLGFYEIMERRGYSRSEADRCLNDEAKAKKMADIAARDWKLPGIQGTPAFAIDGNILAGTHSWRMLAPQIAARF